MAYRTILIDDESLALQRLKRLLKPHASLIEIIDTAEKPSEAIEKINEQKPDLIFLDIQMPEMTGIEMLTHLSHSPLIIFSTAYDEYALQAFEADSIDYLLKPVDPKRLKKAIDKLRRFSRDDLTDFQIRLQNLLSRFETGKKRFQVRVGNRIRFLKLDEIYFFQAKDKYVEVSTVDTVYLINQSLNRLEEELPDGDFVRVHRSALVNINHVAEIIRISDGNCRVRMQDTKHTVLPVSRTARERLLD